ISSNSPSWVEVLPLHGLGWLVVLAGVAHGLSLEIGYRSEYAASGNVALDLREPQLNLVVSWRVGRREVHTQVLMLTEERVNQLGLVCREVVDDDVNFLAARL